MSEEAARRYASCESLRKSIHRYDRWRMVMPLVAVTILLLASLCFTLHRQHNQQQILEQYQQQEILQNAALQAVDSIFDEHVAIPFERGEMQYMEDYTTSLGVAMPLMVAYCDSMELAHPRLHIHSEAYARWTERYNRFCEEKHVVTLPNKWNRKTIERK